MTTSSKVVGFLGDVRAEELLAEWERSKWERFALDSHNRQFDARFNEYLRITAWSDKEGVQWRGYLEIPAFKEIAATNLMDLLIDLRTALRPTQTQSLPEVAILEEQVSSWLLWLQNTGKVEKSPRAAEPPRRIDLSL